MNIYLITYVRKYKNDETCKTLVQVLIVSRLNYGNALLYTIAFSLKNRPQRVKNCAECLVRPSHKREYISPVPVCFRLLCTILFHTFKVLDETAPVYLSDLIEKYILRECSDLSPIHFWGFQEAIQQYTERDPSEHQLLGCGTSCRTTLNLQQVKTYFVRFLKPIYLNWRIYIIKQVYYEWNVFDLFELRICFNCVLDVKRLRAI